MLNIQTRLEYFLGDPINPDSAAVKVLLDALLSWKRVREVATFDEWINNRDRNLGNLLFAGAGEFVMIDHGKALEIDPVYDDTNKLCAILGAACSDERAQITLIKSLQRMAAAFDILHAENPRANLESTGVESHPASAEQFYNFVENRLSTLTVHLQNRFPGQQGLVIASRSSS